jgi:hypothetical protein
MDIPPIGLPVGNPDLLYVYDVDRIHGRATRKLAKSTLPQAGAGKNYPRNP